MAAEPLGGRNSGGVRTSIMALAVALGIHALAAIAAVRLSQPWQAPSRPAPIPVEVQVVTPPPPPPPPPTVAPLARPVPRRPPPREEPRRLTKTDVPPPLPEREPPPPAAPPVFGISPESVVPGQSATAVPVGNTTMTADRAKATNHVPAANATISKSQGEPGEMSAAVLPQILREVNSDDIYPPEARNMGLEGAVDMLIDLDETGKVRHVRVLRKAGHKFDEAAVEAMKMTSFSPARTRDGRPIPYRLTYKFIFMIKN